MKYLSLTLIFIKLISPAYAAIYGEDERRLINDQSPVQYQIYSQAVLSQLRKGSLIEEDNNTLLKTKPLKDHVTNLCTDAPFANTPTFSRCTAFLVAPTLIVTAGHCINNQKECLEARWIFSSDLIQSREKYVVRKKDQVKCKKLLDHRKNSISKNDFALIEIERAVTHRAPLSYRKEGRIQNHGQNLLVIGHPTGLPLISTDQGNILENTSDFLFKISSDTFGGNSGSPVIDSKTGIVEGILTDGDLDYTLDEEKGCLMPYICPPGKCKGENVVRITNIPLLAPSMPILIDPIFDPRNPRL